MHKDGILAQLGAREAELKAAGIASLCNFESVARGDATDRSDAETDMHFASLGRAFQADGRGFSPIEGGLEGGGSVS